MKKRKFLLVLLMLGLSSLVLSNCADGTIEELGKTCRDYGGKFVLRGDFYYCENTFVQVVQDYYECPDDFVTFKLLSTDIYPGSSVVATFVKCGYFEKPLNMKEQNVCKFFSISDGFLGGTVSASGLGTPSMIRLKNDTGIYKLPVVSYDYDADGKVWTGEFATIDPATSQPLVPPGTYAAGCFGENGTASGSGWQVTISR